MRVDFCRKRSREGFAHKGFDLCCALFYCHQPVFRGYPITEAAMNILNRLALICVLETTLEISTLRDPPLLLVKNKVYLNHGNNVEAWPGCNAANTMAVRTIQRSQRRWRHDEMRRGALRPRQG